MQSSFFKLVINSKYFIFAPLSLIADDVFLQMKGNEFLKETVEKLQNQLTKFIIDTNYTNSYSLSLRQKLSNFETKLQKKCW